MQITSLSPKEFKNLTQHNTLTAYYQTLAGTLQITLSNNALVKAQFIKNSSLTAQTVTIKNILLVGTPFQLQVWRALLKIPLHYTMSYQELAQQIGKPKAWRAVANAVGKNPIAYFIPCHRVIRKNGEIGGYRWGIEKKIKLLDLEKAA